MHRTRGGWLVNKGGARPPFLGRPMQYLRNDRRTEGRLEGELLKKKVDINWEIRNSKWLQPSTWSLEPSAKSVSKVRDAVHPLGRLMLNSAAISTTVARMSPDTDKYATGLCCDELLAAL